MSKEKLTKRKTLLRILLIVLAAAIVLSAVIVGMCLLNERPAVQTVAAYQSTYSDTVISVADDGDVEILPQGTESPETGIIFYVGAQITPDAYIPLLARIAEQGYACFIPDLYPSMPKSSDLLISLFNDVLKAHKDYRTYLPDLTEETVRKVIDKLGMKVRTQTVVNLVMGRYRMIKL